ncbi:MAG: hypothetical protein MOB07_00070 [Acidobacteria bacterium]|nr:hypothetical protein [Acidobacteriota bacterium]
MTLNIRAASADDAEAVGRLAQQFADYLRSLGDTTDFKLNAQTYLRDGFGANPAFSGLVAELDGNIVGYLLYHSGYDTDKNISVYTLRQSETRNSKRRCRFMGQGRAL